MKKILIAGAALVALIGTPALAAKKHATQDPPPPVPVWNWTGFYIGPNVGFGWSSLAFTGFNTFGGIPLPTFASTTPGSGFFAGGQAGFNYEFWSNWVVGIEADGEWSNINGTSTLTAGAISSTNTSKLADFGTVRGRLGYAFNNVLLYGTGGWAWGNGTTTSTITSPFSVTASSSAFLSGWAAGGGIEWGFLPNWTVKLEYLYLQFGGIPGTFNFGNVNVCDTPCVQPLVGHATASLSLNTVRIGVNYLFNGAPAPAFTR